MASKKQSSFLEDIINKLLIDYHDNFSQLCIITPNRRAKVFIKNYLQEKGIPMLLPTMFSIDDFIKHLSPYTIFDNVDLSFELYAVYKELDGDEAQPFETFIQWAPMLINDFNEIDMHLGDANALFNYLSDDYAIREWNLGVKDLTDFQKNYLAFFHKLNDYYQYFTQRILSQNAAYNGLSYRYVAEHITELMANQNWSKLIFAGFNALTLSEEKIIRTLYESKQADLFWDVDDYYFSNKNQEAGLFLRKYAAWYKFDKEIIAKHFEQTKEINVIAVPRVVGQAKIAAELLSEKINSKSLVEKNLSNTALVLADESLLMPVLNSLDEEVLAETNVTMGYPLKNTSAHLLLRLFFKMQFSGHRRQKLKGQSLLRFLNEDLVQLLKNPIIADFFGKNSEIISGIQKQLYWTVLELHELFDQSNKANNAFLFIDFENQAEKAIIFFQDLIDRFSVLYQDADKDLQLRYSSDWEAFMLYARMLNRLSDRIKKYGFPHNLQEFKIVFEQLIGNQSQAFHGEPLKGLQLMGLLETRVLDFENLIILSVNEDILPSGKMSNSFIPVDIKRMFNLPTYKEKNSVFAYHFYRLLQRAKNIHLLYSTTAGKLLGGEKSRFITQLMLELPEYNPQSSISEQLYNFKEIKPGNRLKISVEKDKSIQEKLASIAGKGFSPTAINTYINCPLKFYFKHILKISEPEQEESFIDDRMMGNIIHHTLENLFKPFINKAINLDDLSKMRNRMLEEVQIHAKSEAKGQILDSGQNLLTLKGIERYLERFFDTEKKLLVENLKNGGYWTIIGLEQKLERHIILDQEGLKIKIFGSADRIDSWNRMLRVLDYKTGAVSESSLNKIQFEDMFTDAKHEKSVQLLCYAWLLKESNPTQDIQSGIIALRNVNDPYVFLGKSQEGTLSDEVLENFEKGLSDFFYELFDENTPFMQTSEKQNCQYCPYINICLK
ncbi:MAG: PD-(D/E)XK nuclease family protein [Bacteroidales bacterium]|jgi:ATP-dependent helicase/nuclease subunit B|nr:PD-(D/E)XK nuclease family protein [Bacteroidales bacterium]